MANLVMFCILAAVILISALVCVLTKRIMRAATFLLFVLFGIAGIYFLLDYTFLGAAQVAIYAGGLTMLYIFAIQLVSKRSLQGLQERLKGKSVVVGALTAIAGFATVSLVLLKNKFIDMSATMVDEEVSMERIGADLLGAGANQYVLPFEFISVFLLACIIGGIMIARKEERK
ncbi:MAG: NADH-quinone oxidoreductase subunit J [Prevotellaceae bacterium]|nr:NADH-quinone oxidoreductase subunit J [Prevotellaceae bacterium]MDY3365596.1 NADH-quinone oxidoreductase subunit J [Prevotella sp.]